MACDLCVRLLVLWLLAFGPQAKGHGSRQGGLAPPFGSAGSSPRSQATSWDPQYSQLQSSADGFLHKEAGQRYLALAPVDHVAKAYDQQQHESGSLSLDDVVPGTGGWSFEPVEASCPPCPGCPKIPPCPLPDPCPQPYCVPHRLPCPCSKKCCRHSHRCLTWRPW